MNNVCIHVMLLVVTGVLLSSCSQTSNFSLSNSHNMSGYRSEAAAVNNPDPRQEELKPPQGQDYTPAQAFREEVKDTIGLDISMMSAQQPTMAASDLTNKNEKNTAVQEQKSVVKTSSGSTKERINEYRDNQAKAEPVIAPPPNPGRSNGLPLWFIVLCSIFIPPLGVALMYGITDKFWICLLLTFCFWLPGMIYALIQVLR